MKARFVLEQETQGALRYKEIDEKNFPISMNQSQIGTLYLRKSSEVGKKMPRVITVEVDVEK